MGKGPWAGRQHGDTSAWWLPGELDRLRRHNDRLRAESDRSREAGDAKRADDLLRYQVLLGTRSGHHPIPCQWAGDPWSARVLLLLMNPSWEEESCDRTLGNQALRDTLDEAARGDFNPQYPNPFLSPDWRRIDSWHPSRVFGGLHRQMVERGGWDPELAWQRLSQRVCVLELSPWASKSWTAACWGPTTVLAGSLALEAQQDPSRVVLVGRGADEWRKAGLLDVDLLEQSGGVRMNQVRISQSNFPLSWDRITAAVLT